MASGDGQDGNAPGEAMTSACSTPRQRSRDVARILRGIDKTQTEHPEGWWETSAGAQFGAKKLAELQELLLSPLFDDWTTGNIDCASEGAPTMRSETGLRKSCCGEWDTIGTRCADCPVVAPSAVATISPKAPGADASGTAVPVGGSSAQSASAALLPADLIHAVRNAEAKLAYLGKQVFGHPAFTDRYQDGPSCIATAEKLRKALDAAISSATDSGSAKA